MSTIPPAPARSTFAGLDDDDALPGGTRFGELEVLRVVGVGGFGIVYLAMDHALEREVALKEYMPSTLAGRGVGKIVSVRSEAHAPTYALGLRSFVNEARLLARFNHPSLVKVYRFWEENGTAYMVMPFLQGRTLREVRRSMTEPPDQAWILSVINPMMDALEQLHREAVYHRDIAPDNVLLPPNELPVLLDFGAARRAISDRTQTFTAILKPSYAPIEQYAESSQMRQGPWTDIYALGAVMHYLLKASPPAPATTRAMQEDVSGLEYENLAGTTPGFRATVDWMLSVRPGDRPQSIADLRDVLHGRKPVPPRPARATAAPSVATIKPAPAQASPTASSSPPGTTSFAPTMPAGSQPGPATQIVGRAAESFAPTQIMSRTTVDTGTGTAPEASVQGAASKTAIGGASGGPGPVPAGVDPDETVVIRQALMGRSGTTGVYGSSHTARPAPSRPPAPAARSSRLGLWLVIGACLLLLIGMGAYMMFFDHSGQSAAPTAALPEPSPAPASAAMPTPMPATTAAAEPSVTAPAVASTAPVDGASAPVGILPPTVATESTPAADTTSPPDKTADAATSRSTKLTPAEVRQAAQNARDARQRAQARSPESTPPVTAYGDTRTAAQRAEDARRQQQAQPISPVAPRDAPAAPTVAEVNSPRDACGGRVFIALDICMEAQCKSARFANHAQCVRVREIEERRRRPDY